VNNSQALELIGKLIQDGRSEMGMSRLAFAKVLDMNYRTLTTLEKGARTSHDTNQRKVEEALGWRIGAIREVLEKADIIPAESVTLEYMREGSGESSWMDLDAEESVLVRPVTRAGELSNEELLGELAYRLYNKTAWKHPQKTD
jgi:DNA-binding XRE family transcriptional regulator